MSMLVSLKISHVCKAFDGSTVGTKVKSNCLPEFLGRLAESVDSFKFPANGQGVIPFNDGLNYVTSGVARRKLLRPQDYVVREWRGEVMLFGHRDFAEPAKSLSVIVYTAQRYKDDPQVTDEEKEVIGDATHVIVAVLASVVENPPVDSTRFVRNLAGGNRRYSPDNGYTLEPAIEEAREVVAYEKEWVTVAD